MGQGGQPPRRLLALRGLRLRDSRSTTRSCARPLWRFARKGQGEHAYQPTTNSSSIAKLNGPLMTDFPRLIEHAFPLKETSLDSLHEKSVRHGHISTLHIWPARR